MRCPRSLAALVAFTLRRVAVPAFCVLVALLGAVPIGRAQSGAVTPLHTFNGADGAACNAPLILARDGNFYGTTERGGAANRGTVFRVTPGGAFSTIHQFTGGSDGAFPESALLQGSDGNFYGTCSAGGGVRDAGTVFQLTPAGSITPLYAFTGGEDGGVPNAALVAGTDGAFYGTTESGGTSNRGTVFRITAGGAFSTLYSFSGAQDGGFPEAPLLLGADGNFYGTTFLGGSTDSGTLFRITRTGALTTLYRFSGGADGAFPAAALVQAPDGTLFGTTRRGGAAAANAGTVFKLTPAGALTTLHRFTGGADGASPNAALFRSSDGAFYGTTESGGAANRGTVFRVTADGALATLASFTGGADGAFPEAAVVQGPDGALYGTTSGDTATNNGAGSVFRLPLRPPFFNGEVSVGGGFYYLAFSNGTPFGYYNYDFFPYLYHNDLGFEFFIDAGNPERGAYLFDFGLNTFFYTSPSLFPYLFDFNRNHWLYYFPDSGRPGYYTTNPRVFVDLTTGEFIYR